MTKDEFVLACLSPANGEPYGSVQLQKALFLVDTTIPDATGGPHFRFVPGDYGPRGPGVFATVHDLTKRGHIITNSRGWSTSYQLSVRGQLVGEDALMLLPAGAQAYICEVSAFVRRLGFTQLLSAIYTAYPEMAVNAVFRHG